MELTKSKARLWSKLGSRAVFGMALFDMAERGVDFYAMSGDLVRSSGLGRFQEIFPNAVSIWGLRNKIWSASQVGWRRTVRRSLQRRSPPLSRCAQRNRCA